MQRRAYSLLTIKSVDDDSFVIEGIATTPAPDRVGDIVEPLGAKFKLPMPLLWQHHTDKPVGEVTFAKPSKDGIPFKASIRKPSEFTSETLIARALEAWESVKTGLVRTVSIGFSALEYSFIKEGGIHFTEWEWLELSLVTIPAQQEAVITAIKSMPERQAATIAAARSVDLFILGARPLVAPPLVFRGCDDPPKGARSLSSPGASGTSPNREPNPEGAA